MANSEYIGGIGSLIESQTDVATSQTDIFSAPLIDVSLGKSVQYNLRPLSENDSGPYEFRLPGEAKFIHRCEYFSPPGFHRIEGAESGGRIRCSPHGTARH